MDDALTQAQPTAADVANEETSRELGPRAGDHPAIVVLFVLVTVLTLAADLAIKHYAFQRVAGMPVVLDPATPDHDLIPMHDPVTVVPRVLSLRLTTNTGAVFGLGKGFRWLFIVVSVVAVVVITRFFWRSPAHERWFHVCLALILAGALGNLYDRFMYSAVRDMFHLFPGAHLPFGLAWPDGNRVLYPWIFNLADAALVVGVVGVLLITWTRELRRRKHETAPG